MAPRRPSSRPGSSTTGRQGPSRQGGGQTGGRRGSGRDGAGRDSSGRAGGRPVRRGSTGRFASGAARTGAVGADSARRAPKILGGEQVEGRQAVRELLIAGTRPTREVWVAGDLDESEIVNDIIDLARSVRVPVQQVARKRLEAAARSEAPQGVIAFAAPLPEATLEQLVARRGGRQPFLVAVDGVTDPGNLGALLRCCDGAGVSGVVLPRHRAVHVTPTTAKAAAGAVEHVPMAVVGGLPAALQTMRDAGVWIVGLDDGAERSLLELGDLATDAICLVLGAEGSGLSRLVRERCDLIVNIPMLGRLSSLNVSAAAALATYEVARHRLAR